MLLEEDEPLTAKLPKHFRFSAWAGGKGPGPETLRSMTGNGMHVSVMCAIWTFILTTSKLKPDILTTKRGMMKRPASCVETDGDSSDLETLHC